MRLNPKNLPKKKHAKTRAKNRRVRNPRNDIAKCHPIGFFSAYFLDNYAKRERVRKRRKRISREKQ